MTPHNTQAPPHILVTGGSGFFGGILKRRLLAEGYAVTNIDLVPDPDTHPALTSIRGDIRDTALLQTVFAQGNLPLRHALRRHARP